MPFLLLNQRLLTGKSQCFAAFATQMHHSATSNQCRAYQGNGCRFGHSNDRQVIHTETACLYGAIAAKLKADINGLTSES